MIGRRCFLYISLLVGVWWVEDGWGVVPESQAAPLRPIAWAMQKLVGRVSVVYMVWYYYAGGEMWIVDWVWNA